MSMTNMIARFKALWGTFSDSSGTVDGEIRQLFRKHITYELAAGVAGATASQPLTAAAIYTADKPCKVTEILFTPIASSTTTATYTMSWSIIVQKRGGGDNTLSTTHTTTAFVGGLSSVTAAAGAHGRSNSFTGLIYNRPWAPNKLRLAKEAPTKLQMQRGDVLTAQVVKGIVGADSGALFRSGLLKVVIEET